MAGARNGVNGTVSAFRSEVDMLRNVIKRTVDDSIREKLGDLETLKKRQRLIEGSLRRTETKTSLFQDLKPLRERIARIERDMGNIEKTARTSRKEFEKRISEMLKGRRLEKILEDMAESRLSKFDNKILMLRREIEMLRGELESSRVKGLEEELQKGIGNLKSQINKVIIDNRGVEERLNSEVEDLKKGIGTKPGEPVQGIDLEGLRRDMEIIKTKQEWIENNIERIDMRPLLRKVEELEHRIRVIGVSSPIVLE